ncbi:hypothetical protein BB934_01780 [Microvirga ossetica]|uniref:Tyr recombinase domain-containing protein n=2 Tax=Microvirga ossetica TaxID=1882682 RepID=A0A1B2EAX1_9HYPH|nr:hypothetical protein BB934_01780 [Microvirga ossetica]
MIDAGFGSIAHVPVVFDSTSNYCREVNRYLRERATLDWVPQGAKKVVLLAERSLENIARNLGNFIEWCKACNSDEHRKNRPGFDDWRSLTYEDVLQYQRDQRSGAWSKDRRKLTPETANGRADTATDFLQWAAQRGLRPPFQVKLTTVRNKANSAKLSRSRITSRHFRVGREKASRSKALQTALSLPRVDEVRAWLSAVLRKRGKAKFLACRFILEVGARRMEVAALTEDQWPTQETLMLLQKRGDLFATLELIETKGDVPRDVMIPIEYAFEVREWIDGPRLRLTKAYFGRTKERTSSLFLSDSRGYEGTPIQSHTIYDCFHEVKPRPPGWAPHFGRHTFACFFVLRALESEAKILGKDLTKMGADWVMGRGTWWLNLLRRQLGHADEETTEIYLRWLMSATQVATVAKGWHESLNIEDF